MPAHRKSATLHLLTGTYRKDRHGQRAVNVDPIDRNPPAHLRPEHVPAWREIAASPYAAQGDRLAVEVAAVLVTKFRAGDANAAEIAQLRLLLDRLGMTPTGRRALDPVAAPAPVGNAFDSF